MSDKKKLASEALNALILSGNAISGLIEHCVALEDRVKQLEEELTETQKSLSYWKHRYDMDT